MNHTYTLTADGSLNPFAASRRGTETAEVRHPRRIELDGMTLRLLDDEPDLPVGAQVKVWMKRWFHCETLDFIEHKKRQAEGRRAAMEAHDKEIKDAAITKYWCPTHEAINSNLSSKGLAKHLDFLVIDRERTYGVYKAFWRAYRPEDKQKSNDAYTTMAVQNESIEALSSYLKTRLADAGVQGSIGYAYSPREGARDGFYSPGKDHFKLLVPVHQGRFRRDSGDALCKTSDKFWMLESFGNDDRHVSCLQCLGRMIKLLKR